MAGPSRRCTAPTLASVIGDAKTARGMDSAEAQVGLNHAATSAIIPQVTLASGGGGAMALMPTSRFVPGRLLMERRMKAGLRSMLSVIVVMSLQAQSARPADVPAIGLEVGQMYPDFLLPRVDGDLGRLSDFRGKKVLLVHFASW